MILSGIPFLATRRTVSASTKINTSIWHLYPKTILLPDILQYHLLSTLISFAKSSIPSIMSLCLQLLNVHIFQHSNLSFDYQHRSLSCLKHSSTYETHINTKDILTVATKQLSRSNDEHRTATSLAEFVRSILLAKDIIAQILFSF